MKKALVRMAALCSLVGSMITSTLAVSPPGDVVGKITVGYQGWFAAPSDGQAGGTSWWWHWGGNWNQSPSITNKTFKSWPDMQEYTTTFQTAFANLNNGSPAKLFSSYTQATVNTHFLWMQQNGIDTAALQRFNPTGAEGPLRDAAAQHVRTAAETYGRKFFIMYDSGGWTNIQTEIKTDWTNKMAALTSSSAYARQNGKPVVAIWGLGMNDSNHPWSPAVCTDIVNWFKSQGCYVIGGVRREWRTVDSQFLPFYNSLDMLQPWMIGAVSNLGDLDWSYTNLTVPDLSYCNSHNIDYQPCVLPGDLHAHQRLHGDFMWRMFYNVVRAGVPAIYVTMFDEFNEDNQIAKTAPDSSWVPHAAAGTPDDQIFYGLDEDGTWCSSDYYLRLTRDGGRMLKGEFAVTAIRPTAPAVYAPQNNATYHLVCQQSAKALDNSGSTVDGGLAIQWTEQNGNTNQAWKLVSVGGGYYNIICQTSGKALDNSGSTANGTHMKQWAVQSGNINQHWSFVSVGNGYYHIVSRQSGKALDNRGTTADGSNVDQWTDQGSGNVNQNWRLNFLF